MLDAAPFSLDALHTIFYEEALMPRDDAAPICQIDIQMPWLTFVISRHDAHMPYIDAIIFHDADACRAVEIDTSRLIFDDVDHARYRGG